MSQSRKRGHEIITLDTDAEQSNVGNEEQNITQLPVYYPGIFGSRKVEEYEFLNRIEEGAYGVVYRAVERRTQKTMALKRLKMEKERDGFPITSLREINTLLKCGNHQNIVNVKEVVTDAAMEKIFLVMEYVEHDLKSLMEKMKEKSKNWTLPQVKTLLRQLLSGCAYMHEEFVIHRDLKTSNLLMSHNGILKIGDFGLAREFGEPLKKFSPVVVTLWYRAPELLLRAEKYSTEVDMWSVGCIFAEFLTLKTPFPGTGDIDQLNRIFMEIGTPSEKIWPGYNDLWAVKKFEFAKYPYNQLHKKFSGCLKTEAGMKLLSQLLAPCPARRLTASKALESAWFEEKPIPLPPDMFPTWPAKSERNKKPPPPSAKEEEKDDAHELSPGHMKLLNDFNVDAKHAKANGFSLKFGVPRKSV